MATCLSVPACAIARRPSGHTARCASKTGYWKVANAVVRLPLLVLRASSSAALAASGRRGRAQEVRGHIPLPAAALSCSSLDEDSVSFPVEENEVKINLDFPRRRLQVSFTCDACGSRSQRIINPHAYARGTVFVQCEGCDVYHKLVDNLGLIEEYDFRQEAADSQENEAEDANVAE